MSVSPHALDDAIAQAPRQLADTPLSQSWLLGLDTETTGTTAGRDAIVSASLVLRNPETGYSQDAIGEWIINPHRKMDPRASQVNGFTDEFLAEHGEEPTQALAALQSIIGAAQEKRIPLLAYNAPFDVHMLAGDLERWQLPELGALLVADPLVIDRAISKRSGRRTLEHTTEYYGVDPHGDFHDATADTVAAVDLVAPMCLLYPQVGRITLGELMDWQRSAFGKWLESFNSWLQSKGRRAVHDTWL